MAKGKTVTAEEISATLRPLNDLNDQLLDMMNRINNGHLVEVPNAVEFARDAVLAGRNLNDFALRMFTKHRMNELQAKADSDRAEKANGA